MNHFSPVLRWRIGVMLLLSVALLATVLVTSPRSFAHANTSVMSATSQKAVNAADVVSRSLTSAMGKASILKRPGAKVTPFALSKWWVTTFANAYGFYDPNKILYAGYNYVYCKSWGPIVEDNAGNYNHWYLFTDMDNGGQDFVPAYFLKYWGNDQAFDDFGNDIPNCN